MLYPRNMEEYLIKQAEDLRLKPYVDSVGKVTIGYGYNIHDLGITPEIAEALFMISLAHARRDLASTLGTAECLWLQNDEPARYAVLVDMMFNLGVTRFRGFTNMIAAVKDRDWDRAAIEAKDSYWYHQVGRRGPRNVDILRTGHFEELPK